MARAFTYNADPANYPADAVRLEVGDTDAADPLLSDSEIAYCLAQDSTVAGAAYLACRLIVRSLARRVTVSVQGVSKSLSDQYAHYKDLLSDMERRQSTTGMMVWAGGISKADKQRYQADDDRDEPFFARDQMQVDADRLRPVLDGAP